MRLNVLVALLVTSSAGPTNLIESQSFAISIVNFQQTLRSVRGISSVYNDTAQRRLRLSRVPSAIRGHLLRTTYD